MSTSHSDKQPPSSPQPGPSVQHDLEKSHREVNAHKVLRKLDLRLLPLISLLYVLSFLDRANIGNAKVAGLVADLHLTGLQYNLCTAIFFITYCVFEVPSNLALKMLSPSRWLPLIMFCWGCVMISMAFVKNFRDLLSVRIVLGITEAGMFPGLTFYLCTWYPRFAQAQRIGILSASTTIAGAFGGILAYGIERMNGVGGLAGWSWIFLLEGLMTACASILALFFMYDYPEKATFLSEDEQTWLIEAIKKDSMDLSREFKWTFLKQALRDPHSYLMTGVYLFTLIPGYGLVLFLPTIINGLGFSAANAQLLSVPPNAAGCITTIISGILSDKYRVRGPFILVGLVTSLAGYLTLIATSSPGAGYAGVMLVGLGVYPSVACILAWTGGNFGGETKKAVVIAMVIGMGNLGGFASSFVYRPQDSPRYLPGHATNIGCLCVAIVLTVIGMLEFLRQNRKKDARCQKDGITTGSDVAHEYAEMGDGSPLFRYTM